VQNAAPRHDVPSPRWRNVIPSVLTSLTKCKLRVCFFPHVRAPALCAPPSLPPLPSARAGTGAFIAYMAHRRLQLARVSAESAALLSKFHSNKPTAVMCAAWVRRLNQWDGYTALRCEQKVSSLLLLKHCAVAGLKERFEKWLTWKHFATLGRNVVNGNCMMRATHADVQSITRPSQHRWPAPCNEAPAIRVSQGAE
jgi:hypothetical protein